MTPRQIAIREGRKTYFTGVPCIRGHIANRRTNNKICLECRKDTFAIWSAKNPDKISRMRAKDLAAYRRKAGIPEPPYPSPIGCELCGGPPSKGKSLCVDHCHKSGMFRGWLCGRCNKGIGLLRDDPSLLEAAAAYIRKFS